MKTQKFKALVDVTEYGKRKVSYKDYDRDKIIREETRIELEDARPVIYCKIENIPQDLRSALQGVKYSESFRGNGTKSEGAALFGSVPRHHRRGNFCKRGVLSKMPLQAKVLEELAQIMSATLQKYFPSYYHLADRLPKSNNPKWFIQPRLFMANSVYTSGIVNYNNPIGYHYDTANMSGVFSTMLVLRNGMDGGYLVLPKYRIAIECKDGYAVIFDGKKIMHGVSELIPNEMVEKPYRISIVVYITKSLTACEETFEKEMERYRNRSEEKQNNESENKIEVE